MSAVLSVSWHSEGCSGKGGTLGRPQKCLTGCFSDPEQHGMCLMLQAIVTADFGLSFPSPLFPSPLICDPHVQATVFTLLCLVSQFPKHVLRHVFNWSIQRIQLTNSALTIISCSQKKHYRWHVSGKIALIMLKQKRLWTLLSYFLCGFSIRLFFTFTYLSHFLMRQTENTTQRSINGHAVIMSKKATFQCYCTNWRRHRPFQHAFLVEKCI